MCNDHSSPYVTDCNFWDTANYEGDNGICKIDSITAISHFGIQGSGGSGASWNSSIGIDDSDNIDTDPEFVIKPVPGPDGTWGTSDDDYGDLHLQSNSPC